MKKLFTFILSLVCLFGLCTCGETPASGGGPQAGIEPVEQALTEAGYAVSISERGSDFFKGDGYDLTLDGGGRVTVYVFKNEETAGREAECVDESGFTFTRSYGISGSASTYEWVAPPHFFLYKNLIVQYIGEDETILKTLTGLCGGQFAGQ